MIQETRRKYRVTIDYCCCILELCPERYKRWIRLYNKEGRYGDGKPGPKEVPHALLKEEIEKIIEIGTQEEYADISIRQLTVVASEKGIVEASPSSFYREMKKAGLTNRSKREVKNAPAKPEIKPSRQNEVWSWDLTYIRLGTIFVYLFSIIDVYSRKITGWHLSLNATVEAMKKTWDNALSNEELIGVGGAPALPIALSDHGVQMARKSAKKFFKDLGIKQLFARYQTPKDNAWIESWFRILKHDYLKYTDYISFDELQAIISNFIEYYNNKRYHGSIDYVTPSQMHNGEAEKILEKRRNRKKQARLKRLFVNRKLKGQNQHRRTA